LFSHVASTAAGNALVPVVADGFFYGQASGMAPRARYVIYCRLLLLFNEFKGTIMGSGSLIINLAILERILYGACIFK
jgi:hypothetical protein